MTKQRGHVHPLTDISRSIFRIFNDMGFQVVDGPELETEFYNFDALNIPADHPARDMQDTFWLAEEGQKQKKLLRTQTSAVQIRYMENHKPPFQVVLPAGKVFRSEATDATHEAQFHQLEALYIDKNVSLAHLKGVLEHFFKTYFGDDVEIRFRPSYFPFVEPAVEVDMKWKGKWLEVAGAGMVHPNVLRTVNINPEEWKGFALAFGIDRLVMLKYGIDDIRLLYSGDLRFVNQF